MEANRHKKSIVREMFVLSGRGARRKLEKAMALPFETWEQRTGIINFYGKYCCLDLSHMIFETNRKLSTILAIVRCLLLRQGMTCSDIVASVV